MLKFLSRVSLTLALSFVFTFSAWARNGIQAPKQYSILEDKLEIQTLVFQTELYREFKKEIETSISVEEQRTQKIAEDWNEDEWSLYIDKMIKEELIFKVEDERFC